MNGHGSLEGLQLKDLEKKKPASIKIGSPLMAEADKK